MNLSRDQSEALSIALALHGRVKNWANTNTNNEDKPLKGSIELEEKSFDIHYEAREDECHRAIVIDLAADKYDLWFECKGWVNMRKNDQWIYAQRPREDINDKFEGDIHEFISVGSRIIDMFG